MLWRRLSQSNLFWICRLFFPIFNRVQCHASSDSNVNWNWTQISIYFESDGYILTRINCTLPMTMDIPKFNHDHILELVYTIHSSVPFREFFYSCNFSNRAIARIVRFSYPFNSPIRSILQTVRFSYPFDSLNRAIGQTILITQTVPLLKPYKFIQTASMEYSTLLCEIVRWVRI